MRIYFIAVYLLLAAAVGLLIWQWIEHNRPLGRHVSFESVRGAGAELFRDPAAEWAESLIEHRVLVDGEPIVSVSESPEGVTTIAVWPGYSEHHWLFHFPHRLMGTESIEAGVTILPNDPRSEIDDPEIGRATVYKYLDENADGMPDLRLSHRVPLAMDDRAVRWRPVERPWELWPWPDEDDTVDQGDR